MPRDAADAATCLLGRLARELISDEVADGEGGFKTSITYRYVFGPFLKTCLDAVKHPKENYLLIIEEINRANQASLFGDVFQLLDRGGHERVCRGHTRGDGQAALEGARRVQLRHQSPHDTCEHVPVGNDEQRRPGRFPMDTAFKRRWDFRYIGIDDGEVLILTAYP